LTLRALKERHSNSIVRKRYVNKRQQTTSSEGAKSYYRMSQRCRSEA